MCSWNQLNEAAADSQPLTINRVVRRLDQLPPPARYNPVCHMYLVYFFPYRPILCSLKIRIREFRPWLDLDLERKKYGLWLSE